MEIIDEVKRSYMSPETEPKNRPKPKVFRFFQSMFTPQNYNRLKKSIQGIADEADQQLGRINLQDEPGETDDLTEALRSFRFYEETKHHLVVQMRRIMSIADTYDHYERCRNNTRREDREVIRSYLLSCTPMLPRKWNSRVLDYFVRRLYDYVLPDRKDETFIKRRNNFKYCMVLGHVASELRQRNPGIFYFIPAAWTQKYGSRFDPLCFWSGLYFGLTTVLFRFHNYGLKIPEVYQSILTASPGLDEMLRNISSDVIRPLMANDSPPTLLLQSINPVTYAAPLSLTELFSPIDQDTVEVRGGRHASRSSTDIVYDSQ